ncbi:MAG: HD domain-containing protein, partial [Acidimicrobiia bacterium]
MNAEPTPSELAPGQAALQAFLAARRSLAREGPADIAPWEIGAYLTDILDRALSALGADHPRVSVVAVGGFGRGELCLHSDIDVLLLHTEPVPEESIRAILYPLWDAGLRVGHATRTVRSTLAFARDDLSTLCSLLSARLLVGPAEPFTDLITGLGKLLAGARSGLPEQLAAQEQAVWAREPFALQELDLKLGRGGLRTLHRLDWDRRRSELLGEAPHVAEQPAEQEARRTLLAARQALHAVQGRASDRFVIELRSAVANWLGRDPIELATEVYRAARRVDGIASVRWGRVRATGTDPIAHAGLSVARFVRSRWTRGEAAATPLTLARSAAASGQGGHLSRWEWELAERASRPEWTAGNRAGLLSLLAAGRTGWDALLGLWESGWLPRALPELGHVAGLAQAAPFHRHPTDAHLGATVANVVELADSAIGWCGEIAEQIGGLDELLLSAFLHDIGKGLEGDHSQVGADLAVSLLTRTGFGVATAELVGRAVLHHLLLPETAF